MTKEELKEKIEAYEEIINDPSEDQTTRDFAAKKVAKLKDQIAPDEVDEEEIEEVEEVFGDDDEKFQEEVEEAEPKRTPPGPKAKKKKSTKKKGRGRPKKRGRPAKRKATKKATPTKAKAKKMSKDLGLSVKECEELLEKYSSEDKARKSRLAKRKKAGKSAELTVTESLEKEVKTVKNKVEDKKTPTTKAQAKSQGSKITDLVKAILEGIDKKKDKITQIDAIIKGLVAEKKKIMSKKGTGTFLVGTALGGYAGYKLGLSKDKTALKDLFKGEKKLAKDFKDAVKDKQKKDETYTEFEEIYAKGGKIDRDEPIVEFMINTGDREHLSLFRPRKFSSLPLTVEDVKKMKEEKIVDMMYGGDAEMTDYGVDIGDSYVRVDSIMTMGEFIDRGYAKGGKIREYGVDVDTINDQYRDDLQFDTYEKALKVYKEIISKDTYNNEPLDNVQLVEVYDYDFGEGDYSTLLSKHYDIEYAKGGTTYDKEQDERIDENQNMSEEGVQLGDDAYDLAQKNEDKINNIRQGASKVLNNLYEKNPSLKMAHGGVPKNAKWEYPIYFNSDDKEFVAIYYSNEEDVNEADEDFDNRTYNDLTPDVIKEHLGDNEWEEQDVYKWSTEDKYMNDLGYALETSSVSPEKVGYAKGGKTPKFKVRKSFYDKTIGANKKTGTGEDMRSVYHLHIEGTGYGQNYLIDSKTATDEFLEENAPGGYDKGFYVDEEVYVDFTDKDGNKKKGYMIVNNPDLAVRILRDKYNAVSIEDMLTEWEMDDKGKNLDDYTDSY